MRKTCSLSDMAVTVSLMRVDEKALTSWLEGEGYTLTEFDGRGDLWGYTSCATRTVGLWAGLRTFQRVQYYCTRRIT